MTSTVSVPFKACEDCRDCLKLESNPHALAYHYPDIVIMAKVAARCGSARDHAGTDTAVAHGGTLTGWREGDASLSFSYEPCELCRIAEGGKRTELVALIAV